MHKLLKSLLIAELLLLPLIAIASWICSIYTPSVRSLLDPMGLRWITTSFVSNFTRLPIAECLLCLILLSLISSLNLRSTLRGRISQKEKRALLFSFVMFLINIAAIAALTFLPPYILLNFFGTFSSSPFTDSIPGFLFITLETTFCTYAYTSGKMTTMQDFSVAHSWLIVKFSPFFIHLFIIAQIIGWLGFSRLLSLI